MDLVADTEIQIAATTVDLNGNLDVSGTYTGAGLMTTGGNIVIPNAGNIGSASDTDSIAISSGGVVTMNQIPVFSAGINVSGGTIAGTLATAAQTAITSVGTLTALTVDDVAVNGKVVTMTGSTDDTAVFTVGTHGSLSVVTTDTAAAAANIQITADGTAELAGTTVTLDSAGDIELEATNDINIPANVGLTFGDDGEKIEGDGSNLSISANNVLYSGTAWHHTAPLADNSDFHTAAMVIEKAGDTVLSLHRSGGSGNRQLLRFFDGDQGSATHRGFVEIAADSSVNYSSVSDYRVKENETAISDGLTRVKALKPYRFNFKEYPDITRDGFFAHEVAAVVPIAVSGDKDAMRNGKPDYQGLDMTNMIPIIVAAIKEIDARLTAVE